MVLVTSANHGRAGVSYMTHFQHAKGVSKGEMSANVRGEKHPPVVNVCCALLCILLNLLHRKERLFLDNWFPVLYKVRSAEGSGQ